MKTIDLRSDTVTLPSDKMLNTILNAELGDDVFNDDPTVNELQEYAAKLLDKESALFVPSGTMSNQIAIKLQTSPGNEIIVDSNSHIYKYESGAPSLISGVSICPISTEDGLIKPDQVSESIRPDGIMFPDSTLISVENSHNYGGGTVYKLDQINSICNEANKYNLKKHLDGARLFNASIATNTSVKDYSKNFDTISICLSKGLGAPVGSILLGTKTLIENAKYVRKLLGGAMRQVGVLAAPALFALKNNVSRLREDHQSAFKLAQCLNDTKTFNVELSKVVTNIVVVNITDGKNEEYYVNEFKKLGIVIYSFGKNRLRFVTHLGVTKRNIEDTCLIITKNF